jgi:hypothetical protein
METSISSSIPRKAIRLACEGILLIQCAQCECERQTSLSITGTITDDPCICGSNLWRYDKESITVGALAGHLGIIRRIRAWLALTATQKLAYRGK